MNLYLVMMLKKDLTMIISCKHPNPQFEGQTKTKIRKFSEVRKLADRCFLQKDLKDFYWKIQMMLKQIVEKAMTAARARIAAKKARELTRRKSDLDVI